MSKNIKVSEILWKELSRQCLQRVSELKKINEEELLELDEREFVPKALLPPPLKKEVENRRAPPVKPRPPGNDECCGSGCQRCVFDIYYEKLEKYEKDLEEFKKLSF